MAEHRGGHSPGNGSSAAYHHHEPLHLHPTTTKDNDDDINNRTIASATTNACSADSPTPGWWHFDNVSMAQGYNLLGTGRGPIVMSNIFLSTAIIFLASEQVGCVEPLENGVDDDGSSAIWVVTEDCDQRVYGAFRPASLVSNIAVISGVLSALFMPVIGALIDYTPHRRPVGILSALLIIAIQIAQIGTTSSTWMLMAVLQALAGFLYQIQVLGTYAYLPDIARIVGEDTMTKCKYNNRTIHF